MAKQIIFCIIYLSISIYLYLDTVVRDFFPTDFVQLSRTKSVPLSPAAGLTLSSDCRAFVENPDSRKFS